MRKIDWNQELSDEDKVWLRNSGIVGVEDRIKANEEEFSGEYQEPEVPADPVTRSALDPEATQGRRPSEAPPSGAPSDVQGVGAPADSVDDNYDSWKVNELSDEVNNRNDDETNPDKIEVTGTGSGGAVRKQDYINALREWDRAHPDA